jgi:hypothetical protein
MTAWPAERGVLHCHPGDETRRFVTYDEAE